MSGVGRCSIARVRCCASTIYRSISYRRRRSGSWAWRPGRPYLERTLAENAVIDLVPLAADARKNIEAAIAEFQRTTEGVRVDATVADLRLVGIEFDDKTLRVIAEADGTVRVEVTALPAR